MTLIDNLRAYFSGRKEVVNLQRCPHGIDSKINSFTIGETLYEACVEYEKQRSQGKYPSPEHCPSCKYNTDNIRKAADDKLSKVIEEAKLK